MELKVLVTQAQEDYELIDCGEGEKLERYGKIILSRPDPQALSKKSLSQSEWEKAHAKFVSPSVKGEKARWEIKAGSEVLKRWQISYGDLKFWIKTASFKHTGLFPEQWANWEWFSPLLTRRGAGGEVVSKPKVLNLFGYTGGATLACAKAGAEVVHVDGSKVALTWAKENAEISGLKDAPIRWILDDALAFVERELRRGQTYDAIIMDPPAFGRGPEGEVWKIEEKFMNLLNSCRKILSPNPLFILINGYASGYSAVSYENALRDMMKGLNGEITAGELALKSSSGKLLPAGIFARWSKK